MPKLSERMKLILALLEVYGPQPTANMIKIVYPGQEAYLMRQEQYVLRTLHRLKDQGLIQRDCTGMLWEKVKTP